MTWVKSFRFSNETGLWQVACQSQCGNSHHPRVAQRAWFAGRPLCNSRATSYKLASELPEMMRATYARHANALVTTPPGNVHFGSRKTENRKLKTLLTHTPPSTARSRIGRRRDRLCGCRNTA